MIEVVFLFALAALFLGFASIQDIREQEVANWISFSLIIFALGFRFFYSLFTLDTGGGFYFLYQGLIGFVIFFLLGHLFYNIKLFAGGDAKLFIALGTILPLSVDFFENVFYFLAFLLVFLFAGAIYGFVASLVLVSKNLKGFKKEFKEKFDLNKKFVYLNFFFAVFLIILGMSYSLFLVLGFLVLVLPLLYIYAKSVDEACAIKSIPVSKLREGDWLYEDLKLGKNKGSKIILATWEGLSKKEIKLIQKKLRKVKIRQGIAFVPAIFIAFLFFMVFFLVTSL